MTLREVLSLGWQWHSESPIIGVAMTLRGVLSMGGGNDSQRGLINGGWQWLQGVLSLGWQWLSKYLIIGVAMTFRGVLSLGWQWLSEGSYHWGGNDFRGSYHLGGNDFRGSYHWGGNDSQRGPIIGVAMTSEGSYHWGGNDFRGSYHWGGNDFRAVLSLGPIFGVAMTFRGVLSLGWQWLQGVQSLGWQCFSGILSLGWQWIISPKEIICLPPFFNNRIFHCKTQKIRQFVSSIQTKHQLDHFLCSSRVPLQQFNHITQIHIKWYLCENICIRHR